MKYMKFALLPVLIVGAALISSCNTKKAPSVIAAEQQAESTLQNNRKADSLASLLREGDIVARSGTTWDSQQIKDFQLLNKTFTHIGVATRQNGAWVVYHVTGRDSTYKDDHMLFEPLANFLNPALCDTIGLFRFKLLDSAANAGLVAFAKGCYDRRVVFDYFFDIKTDSSMTCSELVAKAVTKVSNGAIVFKTTPITELRHVRLIKQYYRRYKPKDSDIIGRPIITVDALTMHEGCQKIAQYNYEKTPAAQ
jgi:hypothetical protein